MNGEVTDTAGVLGDGVPRIAAAIDRLSAEKGIALHVVYVDRFDGLNGKNWADRTAREAGLGPDDVLFAVAVEDRAYGISLDDRFPLPDAAVSTVETRDVRPRLTAGDWVGAAVAMADGLRTGGSGTTG